MRILRNFVHHVAGVVSRRLRFSGGASFGAGTAPGAADVVAGDPTVEPAGVSAGLIGGNRLANGHGLTLVAPTASPTGHSIRFMSHTGASFGFFDWSGNLSLGMVLSTRYQTRRRDQATTPFTVSPWSEHVIRWTGAGPASLTLPLSTVHISPTVITFMDGTGAAATNPITILAQGADLIDGVTSVTITRNRGCRQLMTDGAGHWYTIGGLFS